MNLKNFPKNYEGHCGNSKIFILHQAPYSYHGLLDTKTGEDAFLKYLLIQIDFQTLCPLHCCCPLPDLPRHMLSSPMLLILNILIFQMFSSVLLKLYNGLEILVPWWRWSWADSNREEWQLFVTSEINLPWNIPMIYTSFPFLLSSSYTLANVVDFDFPTQLFWQKVTLSWWNSFFVKINEYLLIRNQ